MPAREAIERELHDTAMAGRQRAEGTDQVVVLNGGNRLGLICDRIAQSASQREKRDLLVHHEHPLARTRWLRLHGP